MQRKRLFPNSECDFTKYNMFLVNVLVDPGTTSQSTNQNWGINLQEMSVLGLHQGLCASAPLFFSYHFPLIDFWDKLWVGLDLGVGIGLGLCFGAVMLFQDQHKMLIHEHVLAKSRQPIYLYNIIYIYIIYIYTWVAVILPRHVHGSNIS